MSTSTPIATPTPKTVDPWGKQGQARTVIIAYGLGIAIGLGCMVAKLSFSLADFGLYLIAVSLFHLWEYLYVCIYRPSDATAESFMVNHSNEANIAILLCWIEYFVEWYYLPWLKSNWPVYAFAFLFVLGGQALRTIAMMTAAQNFNHKIAEMKEKDHVLVTHGVYSVVRHPSYTGWFVWSVATQVMLLNPICIITYAYVSWSFFKNRIEYEEATLISHFGEEYKQYQKNVPSGIPLVR